MKNQIKMQTLTRESNCFCFLFTESWLWQGNRFLQARGQVWGVWWRQQPLQSGERNTHQGTKETRSFHFEFSCPVPREVHKIPEGFLNIHSFGTTLLSCCLSNCIWTSTPKFQVHLLMNKSRSTLESKLESPTLYVGVYSCPRRSSMT